MKVVRRPLFTWLPVTAGAASYACALWVPLARPQDESAPSLAIVTCAYFFWVLGWNSAIRYTATHLSITNLLVTSTVTWQDVAQVSLDEGLHIELRDGREVGSIAFGDSLIGAFTGYATHRRAYKLLRDAHGRAVQGGVSERAVHLRLSVEWRRPLAAAAAFYGPVLTLLVAGK